MSPFNRSNLPLRPAARGSCRPSNWLEPIAEVLKAGGGKPSVAPIDPGMVPQATRVRCVWPVRCYR